MLVCLNLDDGSKVLLTISPDGSTVEITCASSFGSCTACIMTPAQAKNVASSIMVAAVTAEGLAVNA
jgi:hypothetical protein